MSQFGIAKAFLWAFWGANLVTIVVFWALNSGVQMLDGSLQPALAFGRLTGLLATFAALTQVVIMGREGWLEPVFGLDRITQFHRLNGYTAFILMLSHPLLVLIGYSVLSGELANILAFPHVLLATLGLLLFLLTVGFTLYVVRRRLKFETWYYIHIFNYVAIALLPWHQLTNGGDLLANDFFAAYWVGLYIFAGFNVLVWRIGRPLFLFAKHQFYVEKVVAEAPRATSVYISGSRLESIKAKGGQFVLVRFLAKGLWWQEHPFSLSQLPTGQHLRLTIRQLGDFTNQIPDLKPGTKVMISGPHGAFTHQKAIRDKTLYIAGGVGITPIRSMIEERASAAPHDAMLLYGNRNLQEIIFKEELDKLSARLTMPVHHVLSDEPAFAGEKGFVDREKLGRLVPDIAQRDIFLCGPPPMMKGVMIALEELGVPKRQVHFERFSLH